MNIYQEREADGDLRTVQEARLRREGGGKVKHVKGGGRRLEARLTPALRGQGKGGAAMRQQGKAGKILQSLDDDE